MPRSAALLVSLLVLGACARDTPAPAATATPSGAGPRHLVLVTIDTLRADRVGAYGYAPARTPTLDGLARSGARFERAFATVPITLPSHASLLTGRYPPGHGARDNGQRVDTEIPTLAETLSTAGFATGAFVSAFPLDHRFGLDRGFQTYGDRLPRERGGRPANERPGQATVDDAIAWLDAHRTGRVFLWVHLFEPHAPYGDPSDGRPASARYDDEVAEADRQTGRLLDALGDRRASTLVVVAGDHGEAFGEHGEIGHSLFVYDTTLRVPLVLSGPSLEHTTVDAPVSLVDVAPTVLALLGVKADDGAGRGFDADGIDLAPALAGGAVPSRELYAESFAPLLDFGWSPLRSLRGGGFKFIAAPTAELFDLAADPGESRNLAADDRPRAAAMGERVDRFSPADPPAATNVPDADARARLQALGYTSGSASGATTRPDPKDKRALAARIAQVTSGELQGAALEQALTAIVREDPRNPQAQVRLGYVRLQQQRLAEAESHFHAAIAGHLPGADAYLGLASCQAARRQATAALATLVLADAAEPGNAVVNANRGLLLSDGGRPVDGIPFLEKAVAIDPDMDEARFNLAIALARAGRRTEALTQATALLERLPAAAPQRAEVERLAAALR